MKASKVAAPEVVTVGSVLVEMMRQELDQPLEQTGTFAGPFPAGDAAIYIDTVVRLEHSGGLVGVAGDDSFGRCALERYRCDGVDLSCARVLPGFTTGVAFVAYFRGGSRKYVFHWAQSAAGQLCPADIRPEYLQRARWLHLTGCNIAITPSAGEACRRALELLPSGAKLSFDANIRAEILSVEEIRELCRPFVERADLILPSLGEAAMLTGLADDEAGCRRWAAQGKIVGLKLGARGSRIYCGEEVIDVPGFQVDEVDPTGAGDSFSAGFTVALLEGMDLPQAGRFANAVGAMAVTRLGPMEGAPWRVEVERLLRGD